MQNAIKTSNYKNMGFWYAKNECHTNKRLQTQ